MMRIEEIDPVIMEMASAGSSCSSSIATVANPTKKKSKSKSRHMYNPDGTMRNGLDVGNLFSGTTIKRN